MSHPLRLGLLALAAIVALGAGYLASLALRDTGPDDGGAQVVDFSLPDIDGNSRWLSEWQGNVVVLNFWATWCAPCREEMPLLMDAHERYRERGVRVVGVALDTRAAVTAFAKELRITYPLLIADETGLALMTRFGNSRGALPYTVIIGPGGNVIDKKLGAFRGHSLQDRLESLAKPDAATIMQN